MSFQRGTEHAAEILAWGLLTGDEPTIDLADCDPTL